MTVGRGLPFLSGTLPHLRQANEEGANGERRQKKLKTYPSGTSSLHEEVPSYRATQAPEGSWAEPRYLLKNQGPKDDTEPLSSPGTFRDPHLCFSCNPANVPRWMTKHQDTSNRVKMYLVVIREEKSKEDSTIPEATGQLPREAALG